MEIREIEVSMVAPNTNEVWLKPNGEYFDLLAYNNKSGKWEKVSVGANGAIDPSVTPKAKDIPFDSKYMPNVTNLQEALIELNK